MDDWRVYLVIATGVSALFGVVVNRALGRADEQRRVASTLRAYLLHWQRRALELDLHTFLATGERWSQAEKAAIRRGGPTRELAEELVRIEKEYQEEVGRGLREELFNEDANKSSDMAEAISTMRSNIERAPRETLLNYLWQTRNDILDGKIFVTDKEVAVLDIKTVAEIIELRMMIIDAVETLIMTMHVWEMYDGEQAETEVQNTLIEGILLTIRIGRSIDVLETQCAFYLARTKISAVRSNLFG